MKPTKMSRLFALLTVAFLLASCSSQSPDIAAVKRGPRFTPTALTESQIQEAPPASQPGEGPHGSDSRPETLDDLIDLAYGSVIVDVIDPEPKRVQADNTMLDYYRVRVVENLFGGYKVGSEIDVIMGHTHSQPNSPYTFAPTFVKNERLLLFTQHTVFAKMGLDYPEAEDIVSAEDGMFRFVEVAKSDESQRVMSHGRFRASTLAEIRKQTLQRISSQGVDPDQRIEMRTPDVPTLEANSPAPK